MRYQNNASLIRRNVLQRIAKHYYANELVEAIDKIPYEIIHADNHELFRCCIYKERAIIKYRVMAALGFSIEGEKDESLPLSYYAKQALERTKLSDKVLTVLKTACASCVASQYLVTNACRGCMARPCTLNCPVDAIHVVNGQAVIDHEKCIDCGKCQKVCPYHAIIRIPVPCEEVCPVGAIKKDESNKAVINFDRCISCGKCMDACPFGAVMERSQIIDVLQAMKKDQPVVAMFAPALVGQYKASIEQLAGAIAALGFSKVIEVAVGADVTTRVEIEEFEARMKQGDHVMTSSCCPAYTEAVKRHVPEMLKFVSHAKTPMHYCAEIIKEKYPNAITVFIGPCIAKRYEALNDDLVDYVITFEELDALFSAKDIDVETSKAIELIIQPESHSRGYATSCGVTAAMLENAGKKVDIKPVFINGLDRKGLLKLKAFAKKMDGNFLEVMACEGGCVGGPCTIVDK